MEEKLEVHPVKVQGLFEDVYESTAEILLARKTPLVIECDIDALKFDYDLMKSLLINLIDNASKASESGQGIKLRAYSINTEYRGVFHTIEVSDCGRGIPKDEIDRITDAFYMVDRSRSKKLGGSGLGLALVKRITEAHHAKLVIESELSVGTTVKVIFKDEARV
jgi:two-component system phosphate regulon sensor histidine kinase PhoR